MKRLPLRHARLLVAGAACSLAVTGCGLDQLAEEGAERAVEGGASGDVDVDLDGENGIKVESSDGSFEVGSSELPEDFPSDDVPLIDGELVNAARITEGEDTTWSANLQADSTADDAYDEAVAALEGSGFESAQSTETSGYSSSILEGNGLRVMVSVVPGSADDGVMVSYNVSTMTE